jgi:hypothetical protein
MNLLGVPERSERLPSNEMAVYNMPCITQTRACSVQQYRLWSPSNTTRHGETENIKPMYAYRGL